MKTQALWILFGGLAIAACQSSEPPPPPPPAPVAAPKPPPAAPAPAPTAAPAPMAAATPASAPVPAGEAHPSVIIKTSLGDITVELDREKAPISVENFLKYVNDKFYDGTIFHRVIDGFMIQGGGFTPDMKEKPTNAPIKNEGQNGLKNDRGTIAMARTMVLDSATSQFFINVLDNAALNYPSNGGYAVFGKVTGGMDVVDKIKAVQTHNVNGMGNVPNEPVIIKSIRLKK